MPTNPFYAEFPERNWELQAAEESLARIRARSKKNAESGAKIGAAAGKALRKKPAEANYGAGAIEGGVGAYPY